MVRWGTQGAHTKEKTYQNSVMTVVMGKSGYMALMIALSVEENVIVPCIEPPQDVMQCPMSCHCNGVSWRLDGVNWQLW